MESQIRGLVLVFVVGLLAFTRGDGEGSYTFKVGEQEVMMVGLDQVCVNPVTVTGRGVNDRVLVKCEMVDYYVNEEEVLAVGDRIYSSKDNELIVLDDESCERRTYKDGLRVATDQLTEEQCEEVQKAILKAYQDILDAEDVSSSDSSDSVYFSKESSVGSNEEEDSDDESDEGANDESSSSSSSSEEDEKEPQKGDSEANKEEQKGDTQTITEEQRGDIPATKKG